MINILYWPENVTIHRLKKHIVWILTQRCPNSGDWRSFWFSLFAPSLLLRSGHGLQTQRDSWNKTIVWKVSNNLNGQNDFDCYRLQSKCHTYCKTRSVQCAAVRDQRSLINDAPHVNRQLSPSTVLCLYWSCPCQGHECGTASWPPIIRAG